MTPLLRLVALAPLAVGLAAQVFPPPPEPAGNPSTPGKIALGKALFWDEQLSSTRTMACGTCHRWDNGGSDPRPGSTHPGFDGVFGTADDVHGSFGVVRHDQTGRYTASVLFGADRQVTRRRAPSPINSGYLAELFWDGRAGATFRDPITNQVVLPSGGGLESQAALPPVDAGEMSHIGRTWSDIAAELPTLTPLALATNVPAALQSFVGSSDYGQLFQQVFGSPGVTPQRILFAIAAYERALVSDRSPFDLALIGQHSLTTQENLGRQTFNALCATCHTDVLNGVLANGPVLNDFRNVGVRPYGEDNGRAAVTQNVLDSGKFKVPGLRNVELRAPYFHNGSQATLADVIEFYGRGGDFHVNQDPLIFNIIGALSPSSKLDLEAFLRTLTDPRVQNGLPPFDRPTLWSETQGLPQTFGTGTAGSGGLAPRASAWQPGYVGNPRLVIGVDQAPPGTLTFLVTDLFANTTPTILLGHNVYVAQSPALITAGIGLTLGSGPAGGYLSLPIAVPNDPGLAGATLFGQWLVVDPAGPFGFASSDAFGVSLF